MSEGRIYSAKSLMAVFSLAFLWGCGGAKTPVERTARSFIDHYYVQTDLRLALEDCDGYAREKVRKSLQLTEGQLIDASTHHPKISYKLVESRVDGPEANYLYQVQIEPEKMKPIRKKTFLKLRERGGSAGGGWKVTQFSDYDMEVEVPSQ